MYLIETKSKQKMDTKELKSKIPHGYIKVIAKRAGVSQTSVSKFLAGKFKSYRIEKAALEVLSELGIERKQLLANI